MELCVKMQVVKMSEEFEGLPDLYIEDGETTISALAEPKYFSAEDLSGIRYQELSFELEDETCVLLELKTENESYFVVATEEEFEDILKSLGLLPEDQSSELFTIEQSASTVEEIEENAA